MICVPFEIISKVISDKNREKIFLIKNFFKLGGGLGGVRGLPGLNYNPPYNSTASSRAAGNPVPTLID